MGRDGGGEVDVDVRTHLEDEEALLDCFVLPIIAKKGKIKLRKEKENLKQRNSKCRRMERGKK